MQPAHNLRAQSDQADLCTQWQPKILKVVRELSKDVTLSVCWEAELRAISAQNGLRYF